MNRTEHPRLAERVRCLCVGCDVTWGPLYQALVTQLPANRWRWAESNRPTQSSNNTTINTAHSKFYVVRREAYVHGRSRESIFIGKGRKGLHAQDLSSLFAKKEKVTRDAIENLRPEIWLGFQKTRRAAKVEGEKSKKKPFFRWRGVSIYRREPPSYESRPSPVKALAAGHCDWLALDW